MRWLFCSSTFDNDRGNSSPHGPKPKQNRRFYSSSSSSSSSYYPSKDNEIDNTSSAASPRSQPCPRIRSVVANNRAQPWSSSKQQFDTIISPLDLHRFGDPHTLLAAALLATGALAGVRFYRTFLRRIPNAKHIPPKVLRRRVLLGRVTSVGDGDNFHMYHTPGGRFAGWDWLRKVPATKKELRQETVRIIFC